MALTTLAGCLQLDDDLMLCVDQNISLGARLPPPPPPNALPAPQTTEACPGREAPPYRSFHVWAIPPKKARSAEHAQFRSYILVASFLYVTID